MCVSVDDDYRERIIDRLSATGEREGGGGCTRQLITTMMRQARRPAWPENPTHEDRTLDTYRPPTHPSHTPHTPHPQPAPPKKQRPRHDLRRAQLRPPRHRDVAGAGPQDEPYDRRGAAHPPPLPQPGPEAAGGVPPAPGGEGGGAGGGGEFLGARASRGGIVLVLVLRGRGAFIIPMHHT